MSFESSDLQLSTMGFIFEFGLKMAKIALFRPLCISSGRGP